MHALVLRCCSAVDRAACGRLVRALLATHPANPTCCTTNAVDCLLLPFGCPCFVSRLSALDVKALPAIVLIVIGQRLFMRVEWEQNLASPLHWARLGLAPHRSATPPCRYVHPDGSPSQPFARRSPGVGRSCFAAAKHVAGRRQRGLGGCSARPQCTFARRLHARYPVGPTAVARGGERSGAVRPGEFVAPRQPGAAGARTGWGRAGQCGIARAPGRELAPCGCCHVGGRSCGRR